MHEANPRVHVLNVSAGCVGSSVVGSFVVSVAYKIFNVRPLAFFLLAQPKLCCGRHWFVSLYSTWKTLFTDTY